MTQALHALPTAALRALAASLRSGPLSLGVSHHAVTQIAGPVAAEVEVCLQSFHDIGMSPAQIALIAEAIADARERTIDPAKIIELVISGPDVPGVPTSDTAATMRTLISEAMREILLVGYAVHNAQSLFAPLAARMAASRALRVVFCLDIPRRPGDTSLDSEIVRRFALEFRGKHWPWPLVPDLFYDPRSLSADHEHRSSLHAKCVIVDRSAALITSANFTQAAQQRNIEVGLLIRHPPIIERLACYFDGLIDTQQLVSCPLA
ncbi:MAG: DISARM system phospholipase D-like protein DrmC [Candidatus Binatia bacterium]|jgi:phosphatidylserine/phosphatidylglycerophosphate/cardiolipin synthase-like enzyme